MEESSSKKRKYLSWIVYVSIHVLGVIRHDVAQQDGTKASGNGSMVNTWVTDLAREVVSSCGGSERTSGFDMWILMIGLPSALLLNMQEAEGFQSSFSRLGVD